MIYIESGSFILTISVSQLIYHVFFNQEKSVRFVRAAKRLAPPVTLDPLLQSCEITGDEMAHCQYVTETTVAFDVLWNVLESVLFT